jgi:hypothetical protein
VETTKHVRRYCIRGAFLCLTLPSRSRWQMQMQRRRPARAKGPPLGCRRLRPYRSGNACVSSPDISCLPQASSCVCELGLPTYSWSTVHQSLSRSIPILSYPLSSPLVPSLAPCWPVVVAVAVAMAISVHSCCPAALLALCCLFQAAMSTNNACSYPSSPLPAEWLMVAPQLL